MFELTNLWIKKKHYFVISSSISIFFYLFYGHQVVLYYVEVRKFYKFFRFYISEYGIMEWVSIRKKIKVK